MSARKIVITSGKGGAGKTTITANLGYRLSDMGERVVAVDIDFGLNNLDVVMGMENKVVYDIIDVIEGRCRAKQALLQDSEHKNLYVLPSSHNLNSTRITGQNIKMVTDALAPIFDYILFDCPAGIDVGFHRAVSASDEAIVVTTPHISCIRDADKVISLLKSYNLKKVGLVVNRARGDLILDGEMIYPDEIEKILKTKLYGVIPEEDNVFLTASYGQSVDSGSALKAFKFLAKNIHFEKEYYYDCTEKYLGFFGKVKRVMRRL